MTRLIILGSLLDGRKYGYEIVKGIKLRFGGIIKVSFGSLYYHLSRMVGEGLVNNMGGEREGGRPERQRYEITSHGREEFKRLMKEAIGIWSSPAWDVDVALSFWDRLPGEEVIDALERREALVAEQEQRYSRQLKAMDEMMSEEFGRPLGPGEVGIYEHALAHLEAEKRWLIRLRKTVAGRR